MTTGLYEFFKFNRWANLKLLDSCSELTDTQLDFTSGGVYGSIRNTLVHILTGEERDMRDCKIVHLIPSPQLDESMDFPGFDVLRQRAEHSGTELIKVAEQANLYETLHLPEDYIAPMYIVLNEAICHGIEHRSQIATLLTLQGIRPPRLDVWGYNNEAL